MQITSSTIGRLYSTNLSSGLASTTSGSRQSGSTARSGADVVTLSSTARALAEAEQTAANSAETTVKAETARDAALKVLNDYIDKGPVVARVEAIREEVLKSMGLSEADLKNLPPEQQQQIEETIAERIKEQLMQKKADKSGATIEQSAVAQPPLQASGAVESSST